MQSSTLTSIESKSETPKLAPHVMWKVKTIIQKDKIKKILSTKNPDEIIVFPDIGDRYLYNLKTGNKKALPFMAQIKDHFVLSDGRILFTWGDSWSTTSILDLSSNKETCLWSAKFFVEPNKCAELGPDEFVCVEKEKPYSLLICKISDFEKPVCTFDAGITCCSLTTLGENHIVVGGLGGEVFIFERSKDTFVKKHDLTKDLLELRERELKLTRTGLVKKLVKTLTDGTLVIIDDIDETPPGLISTWSVKGDQINKINHTSHPLKSITTFYDMKENGKFALTARFWDSKFNIRPVIYDYSLRSDDTVQSVRCNEVVPLANNSFIDYPFCHNIINLYQISSSEQILQMYIDKIDECVPQLFLGTHGKKGGLPAIIANYAYNPSDEKEKFPFESKEEKEGDPTPVAAAPAAYHPASTPARSGLFGGGFAADQIDQELLVGALMMSMRLQQIGFSISMKRGWG